MLDVCTLASADSKIDADFASKQLVFVFHLNFLKNGSLLLPDQTAFQLHRSMKTQKHGLIINEGDFH
jgi:hypothetical protein